MKKIWSILFSWIIMISLFSCGQRVSIDNRSLVEYFETKAIDVSMKQNNLTVLVEHSRLVEAKMGQKDESKEYSLEQFASLGALLTSMNVDSSVSADSVTMHIKSTYGDTKYSYSLAHLKKIIQYAENSVSFAMSLNGRDYSKLKPYLSDDIVPEGITQSQLDVILAPLYSPGKILDAKLIAFKIHEGIAGLYVNVYYEGNIAKTYIFSFRVEGDAKIAGIQTPW